MMCSLSSIKYFGKLSHQRHQGRSELVQGNLTKNYSPDQGPTARQRVEVESWLSAVMLRLGGEGREI